MLKFENGRHLSNYLIKILKNTNSEISSDHVNDLRHFKEVYEFIDAYIDIVECPVTYDNSFANWIALAQQGKVKDLLSIVKNAIVIIDKFKNKEVSFDKLFPCLDLNMNYRNGYLSMKPNNGDIYYPFTLNVLSTKIRNSTGTVYCYSNPKKYLTNNYGCYFIYDYDLADKIVYVGKSNSNLLQRCSASARQRVDGKFHKIDLLEMPTHADTNIYELYYIAKYNPIFNTDSICNDSPSFELEDIAKHNTIELIKEEGFSVKQLCFDYDVVTKEDFWSSNEYLLFNERNIEKKRKELSDNIHGIVDGSNIFSCKELYENDGYLCSMVVTDKKLEPIAV